MTSAETEINAVLLVGSGAIENSWEPVKRALARVHEGQVLATGTENLAFANIVFQLRWLYINRWFLNLPTLLKIRETFRQRLGFYDRLRAEISSELSKSLQTQEISTRKTLVDCINKFLIGKKMHVITTNWDLAIEAQFEKIGLKIPIIHLHGSVTDTKTLYLPTEILQEPYRSKDALKLGKQVHWQTVVLVERADLIVIIGLSLSPLDAELNLLLGDALNGVQKPRTVVIVDPDPQPVADRVRFYYSNCSIQMFTPDQL